MSHPVIKKLQVKDQSKPILILHAPQEYEDVLKAFAGDVHQYPEEEVYSFIQIFGTTNESLEELSNQVIHLLSEDGLFWLCYPKKSSKTYKGSNCSRETVGSMLADHGFEPVRQVAIDEDWSALRYRSVNKIKKLTRNFAVTEEGKKRTDANKKIK